jgi:hypothetical protein
VLNEFVEYRNKAAHTNILETVATDEVKSIADCLMVSCEALAQLVMKQVVRRQEQLGRVSLAGSVIHRFSGLIIGASMHPGRIAVGGELVVVQKYACYKVRIESIQIRDLAHEQLDVCDGQEIGLRLNLPVSRGALLMRLPDAPPSTPRKQTQANAPLKAATLAETDEAPIDPE